MSIFLLPPVSCSPAPILCPAIAHQSDTQQIVAITQHQNFTCPVAVGHPQAPPPIPCHFSHCLP